MKTMFAALLLLIHGLLHAQSLTLRDCYVLSEQNYPLVKQRELITKASAYSIENLSKGFLPQVTINGSATYQSAVTQIPIRIPGTDISTLSKDQYKIYGEVSQTLLDGGVIRQQKQSQEVNTMVEEQKLEVELYKLKERINQLYFGILLVDEQIKQADLLKNDIQIGIRRTEAAVVNGTAFKSSLDVLKAELLKSNQRTIELASMRTAYADMLGLFINRVIDTTVKLEKPAMLNIVKDINRPEIRLYDYQSRSIDAQDKLLSARNRPRVNLFLQGGYGRPALNMLSNNFDTYYLGGVRLNWSLSGLYTMKKEKAVLELNRRTVELQKETFLFNTIYTLRQQNAEVNKYMELMMSDSEIVTLRNSIKTATAAQLENGVVNTSDYLREVNAEDQARQNKIIHEIQLLMAQYAQQVTTGNSL